MAKKASQLPTIMQNNPNQNLLYWLGYFAKRDKTMMPGNSVTQGTINCFIPDGDKIVPRHGSKLFGQSTTEDVGIIGHKKKYKNLGGVEMEVRAYRSLIGNQNDVVQVQYDGQFVNITELNNNIPKGNGRIYFDTYFNTNLDPSKSQNLPLLVWVSGYENFATKKGQVYSWTGGIAKISSVTPTTITIAGNKTFRQLGFRPNTAGNAVIVINGSSYTVNTQSELDTNTVTIASTTGMVAGNFVTNQIEINETPIRFDMCRQSQGYMFYGNFNEQRLWMSNAYNRSSSVSISGRGTSLDDMFIPLSSDFTGSGAPVYRIEINNTPIREITSSTTVPIFFSTTGYTGTTLNEYDVVITQPGGPLTQYFATAYKNGSPILGSAVSLQNGSGVEVLGPFPMTDGLSFYFSPGIAGDLLGPPSGFINYTGALQVGMTWKLRKNNITADSFVWSVNGGARSAPIQITGGVQTLSDGVQIQFTNTIGHQVGDFWTIQANQKIDFSWANFYYTLDVSTQQSLRRPGEGYIYNLPSNFWTMDKLEESIFINTSNGEWGYVTSKLSADLKSETIDFTQLKQAGENKVLYPYLTGHSQNDLLFINENKQLDSIGRIQLTERLQVDYISDPVKNDFLAASFINGSIEFQDKKIWITSPDDFKMFVYDDYKEYWQPPQVIPENALLTVIGNKLCSHSHVSNTTRTLNDPTAVGDDGSKYKVRIYTSTYDYGDRWTQKTSNETFFEAYIRKPVDMFLSVHLDVDEPDRTREHLIKPIFGGETTLQAPFGEGNMGSHAFGSDDISQTSYAREVYNKLGNITFYFAAMDFFCDTEEHKYEILSMGLNMVVSKANNKKWIDRSDVENDLLPI